MEPDKRVRIEVTAELTIEQKFQLRSLETQVDRMSLKQRKEFILNLYEQMLVQKTLYNGLLKQAWGIDGGTTLE